MPAVNSGQVVFLRLLRAQYNSLQTKEPNTVYFITDTEEWFWRETLYAAGRDLRPEDVLNVLNSTAQNRPLSANQGRVLDGKKVDRATFDHPVWDGDVVTHVGFAADSNEITITGHTKNVNNNNEGEFPIVIGGTGGVEVSATPTAEGVQIEIDGDHSSPKALSTTSPLTRTVGGTTTIPLASLSDTATPRIAGKTLIGDAQGTMGVYSGPGGGNTLIVTTMTISPHGADEPTLLGNVATKADLPLTASAAETLFGRTPNVDDYARVLADEDHDGATYEYYITAIDGSGNISWGNEIAINTSDYQEQTAPADAGKLLTAGNVAGRYGTPIDPATFLTGGDVVTLTGDQSIGGTKTFTEEPVIPAKSTPPVSPAGTAITTELLAAILSPRIITAMPFEPFLKQLDGGSLQIASGTAMTFNLGGSPRIYYTAAPVTINVASALDTGSIANGKDYKVFLCWTGTAFIFKVTLAENDYPSGYGAGDAKLIGGFHTLCVAAGSGMTYWHFASAEALAHPLNGYVAGDILPQSVWCLNHRPHSEPEGMVYIPPLDFWCDIYLQSGSGEYTRSAYQGAITRTRQYVDFVEDQFCVKKALLNDEEFAAAALGSNEQTNISGSAFVSPAGGHSDTAGRRMISIYGVEEMCGLLWQWLATTSAAGVEGSIYGQTATTPTYGWLAMTQSSNGPYGQSGGKGSFWGLAGALLAGGAWSHGASCGSRARDAVNARSDADANCGGRGRSRALHA
jgi:hypothetical protein